MPTDLLANKPKDLLASQQMVDEPKDLLADKPKDLLGGIKYEKPSGVESKPQEKVLPMHSRHPAQDWLERQPTLYGLYGAVKETGKSLLPYIKYADPEERKAFMKLDKQHQIRDLLLEDLNLVLFGKWKGLATDAKYGAKKAGEAIKKHLPKTHERLVDPLKQVLTKKRTVFKTKPKVKDEAFDLLLTRATEIDVATLESGKFIQGVEQSLSKAELEAVPFIRQGIKDPQVLKKIGREDLIPLVEKPSKQLLETTKKVGNYYDEMHGFLKEHWDDPGFVDDYVTQIWNIPKGRKNEVVNYFTTQNPFLKERTIPTLEEGIKKGLTPKTTNIAKLLRIYDDFRIKTAYNYDFAKGLVKLTDEAQNPVVMRIDKAPNDWVKIDHPALNRAKAVGKTTKKVKQKDTEKIITETVEKIKTIERTVPGDVSSAEVNGRIKSLEKIITEALESRGMTNGEANAYLSRLKAGYAGKEVKAIEAAETVSETSKRSVSQVIKEINKDYPVDVPILQKVPVKVHPDIADEVKLIFDDPFSNKAISAMETVNAFTKKGRLSLSFFHHFALTESAFSTGVGRKALAAWNPFKIYRALSKGEYDVFNNMDLAKEAIRHRVKLGVPSDVQANMVEKALVGIETATKGIPLVGKGTKAIRKTNTLWDKALWDYYHNALKMYAYEHNAMKMLKGATKGGKTLSEKEINAIKDAAGDFVNDSFGGQNWDLQPILGNPKIRQMLHWGFLAPDWTISTLKQAIAPVKGLTMMAKGGAVDSVVGKSLAKRGASFWVKAAMYYNIIAQSTNYHNTKRDYGEGRFTWENAPGHSLNIYMGKNRDGTERYLRLGKQFREVLEWGEDPLMKAGAKIAPVAGEAVRQFAAHDPGSGYPTDWAEHDEFWEPKALKARAKSLTMMPIPFSLRPYVENRPKNFLFALPTSKGMTNYKTVKLFKEALGKKDNEEMRRIFISALQNNLNAQELFKSARSAVKSDITYNNKMLARDIYDELRGFNDIERADALMVHNNNGTLTPEVAKQLIRLYKDEENIKAQKVLLGIK